MVTAFCVLNCVDFSRDSAVTEKCLQPQKRLVSAEVKCPVIEEKSEIFLSASDAEEIRCTNEPVSVDARHTVKVCTCQTSDVSSNMSTLDKMRDLYSRGRELSARDHTVPSCSDFPLCSSCRDIEQRQLLRPVRRPRSLEVTKDIRVNIEGYQYENVEHFLRIPSRATSGSGLDVEKGENKEVEEDESHISSLASVSAAVGHITSSASVDTAIGHTIHACKCDDMDLVSYRLMQHSVDLESPTKNAAGVSAPYLHEPHVARMPCNQTAHCSHHPSEVLLLNDDLLKHCSRHIQHTHSVSMPIDIVSAAQHLPPDHRVSNLLASTTAGTQSQELQPLASACSMPPPAAEAKAARKRAYRVGLNLFNR